MAPKVALFNHKGGVGKTTLIVNVARGLSQLGLRPLIVDLDPQCNATAFYLSEKEVDALLDESIDPEDGGTIWSGIAKAARGRGDVRAVQTHSCSGEQTHLLPGDVLLGSFEDRLATAWKDSFSRDATALDLMSALHRSIDLTADKVEADIVLIDVGPSVGSLNRSIILGCDYFAVPVGCDLFSLRALRTLGQTMRAWIKDWETIKQLAESMDDVTLLEGRPTFLGYITQHFNIYRGRSTSAFDEWETKIPTRIARDLTDQIAEVAPDLIPQWRSNKVGAVPAFHSLAPLSQSKGIAIGGLRGVSGVNSGHYEKVDEADRVFKALAQEIAMRVKLLPTRRQGA
jgi:cellulose biosynthesis protein BcsQ